jgi:outer membrane protein assembly factor BamB
MILASEQRRLASLSDGRITPVADMRPCTSRLDAALGSGGAWDMAAGRRVARVEAENLVAPGMTIEQVWGEEESPYVVAFGNRTPGTEVPMISVFQSQAHGLLWSSDVPAGNALRADDSLPDAVAISGQRVVVAYGLVDDSRRVTAFDLATGRRLWDSELPDETHDVQDIEIEGGRAYVSHWTWLDVFDVENGSRQYRIGRWQ